MASCPNINSNEWKSLVKEIGEAAAWADYLKTGEIRTLEQIRQEESISNQEVLLEVPTEAPIKADPVNHIKVEGMNTVDDAIYDTQTLTDEQIESSVATDDSNNQNVLLKSMMERLNIDAEFISPTKAKELTKESGNVWDPSKPAFYVGGKVYFVIGSSLSAKTVFHEFAHPFVRAISVENPTLFDKLYNDIINTSEGAKLKSLIEDKYKFSTGKSISVQNQLKEELIVQALTEKAKLEEPSSGFTKAIKNLLYQIKQFFRKTYGKNIKISKLDENTSIEELADMMLNAENITLPKSDISQSDVVAYLDERSEFLEDLAKIKDSDVLSLVDRFYSISNRQVDALLNNNNFDELAQLLTDEYKKGDLQKIRANTAKYQSKVKNLAESVKDENEYNAKRLKALMETFLILDKVMRKIDAHMQELKDRPDNQETMQQVYHYQGMIDYWQGLMDEANEIMDDSRINVDSPVVKTINNINRSMQRINDAKNEIYSKGARDTLYEQLEPMGRTLKDRYDTRIANLRDKGAPQSRIDKLMKEYYGLTEQERSRMEELQKMSKAGVLTRDAQAELKSLEIQSAEGLAVTPEKIEALLKGEAGDANYFNSFFEGYLYNTDPVIGGLALYVKNQMNDVMAKAQANYNQFSKDINELMDKAGINRNKIGELGKMIGDVDLTSFRDKDGNIKEKEVWAFVSRFKNYRVPYDQARDAVEKAHTEHSIYQSKETKQNLVNAIETFERLRRDYYYDQFTEEYYKRTDLFSKDEIGKKAKNAREEIVERINALTETTHPMMDEEAVAEEVKMLWREYSQLGSLYYLDGTKKVDDPANGVYDLSIAQRIQEYNAMTRDMYETRVRRDKFQSAREAYRQSLIDKGITPDNPITQNAFYTSIKNWDKLNTKIIVKSSFYKERDEILKRIETILKKIDDDEEADKENQSKVWKRIFNYTAGFKDENGHFDALGMEEGAIASVKEAQQELQDMRDGKIRTNGLNAEENAELNAIYEIKNKFDDYRDFVKLYPEEAKTLKELNAKKRNRGLSKADRDMLSNEYAKLANLMETEPTDQYVDVVNNLLSTLEPELVAEVNKVIGENTVDKTSVDLLLEDKALVDKLRNGSSKFKEWFDKNHLSNTFFDIETKSKKTVYKRLYVWSVTKPANPKYYENYEILDEDGNVVETIAGVPNNEYTTKILKKKYITPKIVGKTVDNRGNWLPKTVEDGAKDKRFYNEKYDEIKSNPALFELMEKMKEHHLKNQEGLNYKSRLYLDFPRFKMGNLETWQSTTVTEKATKKWNALTLWAKKVKDFIKGDKDDAERGLNYDDAFNLVRADMFDNEVTNVPIAGLYDIDIQEVSTNIAETMMRYMMSGERQKALVKALPTAKAIQSVVKSSGGAIKDSSKINKQAWLSTGIFKFLRKNKKGDKSVRQKAIDNFIEREFEGKRNTGAASDNTQLNNFANLLFKRASFGFFALNIPSALKNSYGAKFQGMIEASAGNYFNHVDFQKGNAWSYKTMAELSFGGQLYKKGAKSLNLQIVEIFDPAQDRFEEKFGEGLMRTGLKDAADMNWLYSTRKWLELQATTQLFGGMMYRQKVEQVLSDGTKKEISYIDAWELVDEQVVLKDGIDIRWSNAPVEHILTESDTFESLAKQYNIPADEVSRVFGKYSMDRIKAKVEKLNKERAKKLRDVPKVSEGMSAEEVNDITQREASINNYYDSRVDAARTVKIDNTNFKNYKAKIHQVSNNLQGTYAKFDQPEAQRYIAFRFVSYLRRYFTSMTMNRWGHSGKIWDPKPRFNPGLGDVQMGYYVQFLNTLKETVTQLGKNLPYMEQQEKAAAMKVITEVGMLFSLTLAMGLLFGWDPDDPEKWDKLRGKSGPAPFLGLTDSDREFNFGGYMSNHSLYMLWLVHSENKQFIPLPGYGLNEMTSMLDLKSVVTGPTIKTYQKILDDNIAMITGSESAYYTRDVGPYRWQKEGSAKVWNDLARIVGLTGSTLDPGEKGFKSGFTAQALARR